MKVNPSVFHQYTTWGYN